MGRYPGVILPRYPSVTQRYVFGPFSSVYRGNGPEKTAQVLKSGVISTHIDRGAAVKLAAILPLDLRRFWPAFIQTAARERQQGAA